MKRIGLEALLGELKKGFLLILIILKLFVGV